jgi:membrane protein
VNIDFSSIFLKLKERFSFTGKLIKESFLSTFYRDNCSLMAAAISFYLILSVIPLFLVFLSISAFVLHSSEQAYRAVSDLLIKSFPESTTSAFKILFDLMKNKTVFGIIGLLGLIWGAARIFAVTESAMNIVWKVEKGRAYLKSKFLSILLVPVSALIMLSSMALTVFYTFAKNLTIPYINLSLKETPWFSQFLAIFFPTFLGFVLFFLIYTLIPNKKISIRAALLGAACASIFWEIAKFLFDVYIKRYTHFQRIYGSFGTLVVMLIWIYYSAFIILAGAEIGANYQKLKEERNSSAIPPSLPQTVGD